MKRSWLVWLLFPVVVWGWGDDLAKQNRQTIAMLQQRIQAQQERIDGLVSVIEGLNETIARLQSQKNDQDPTQKRALILRIEALEQRLAALEEVRTHTKPNHVAAHASSTRLPPPKRYAKAVHAYKKRAYESAEALFGQLVQEHYKVAASQFYLGEIAYYTKRYDDAIYHYKQSADANDKAGYMDVLMLHTAVSLEKTGKKDQARAFYQAVIKDYANRKSAAIAKRRLGRMR